MTAHVSLSLLKVASVLAKKTQGSAWCTIKKGSILLSENWRLYLPQRDIRFRTETEKRFEWHLLELNTQVTTEYKDIHFSQFRH